MLLMRVWEVAIVDFNAEEAPASWQVARLSLPHDSAVNTKESAGQVVDES